MIDVDRYRQPSRMSEAILLGVPVIRTEPCACGGSLTAPSDSADGIRAAVQTHIATRQHQLYRLAGDAPTAVTGLVDVSVSRDGASGRPLPVAR